MTEKLKGKAHPFTGHLRRSEKVLWVMPQESTDLQVHAKRFIQRLALLLILPALYLLSRALRLWLEDYYYLVLGIAFICLALSVIVEAIKERFFPPIYALTNERLLSWQQKQVTTFPLEDIQSINIVSDELQRPTLSFSPYFLIWSGVSNAEQVKRMIEEAQAHRQQEIAE